MPLKLNFAVLILFLIVALVIVVWGGWAKVTVTSRFALGFPPDRCCAATLAQPLQLTVE